MDYKMSKFDIDRIACLMYRDIAAYIDDQRKQSSDCDAAARKEEKQNAKRDHAALETRVLAVSGSARACSTPSSASA